jgi:hypothetical protein
VTEIPEVRNTVQSSGIFVLRVYNKGFSEASMLLFQNSGNDRVKSVHLMTS